MGASRDLRIADLSQNPRSLNEPDDLSHHHCVTFTGLSNSTSGFQMPLGWKSPYQFVPVWLSTQRKLQLTQPSQALD